MIRIRRIKEADIPRLGKLYVQIYKKHNVGEAWTVPAAQRMLRWYLKIAQDMAYLAEDDGQIIGAFLVGVKPWWDGNHLLEGEIFVHHDYQRSGIGSALMKKILEHGVKKYRAVIWEPFAYEWDYPFKWYKSLGFKKVKGNGLTIISAKPKDVLNKLKRREI